MNNQRRKELKSTLDSIQKAQKVLQEAIDTIDCIIIDEQDAYDNLPDGLKETERGENMYYAIDRMTEIYESINSIYEELDDVEIEIDGFEY